MTIARSKDTVEKVARAIWHAQWEETWPREGGIEHAQALTIARAAINAMSDVRDALEEARDALKLCRHQWTPWAHEKADKVFPKIDAALESLS